MCASREQPLVTQAQIEAELHYVVGQGEPLLHATLHRELPIDTVTLFTRTADEYDAVYAYIAALGPRSPVSHGQTVYVEPADLIINDWRIKYAGVRKPDQSRVERGYVDYPTVEFAQLGEQAGINQYLSAITSGRGQTLIELRHPDFDIRGYIVPVTEH